MDIKIKKLHDNAVIPFKAYKWDAGFDLTAISKIVIDRYIEYGTGLAFEIPDGYVGLIFPRSSVYKTSSILSNCVGVIDSGYRGEVKVKFYYSAKDLTYDIGDRVAQIIFMPLPEINLIESETLSDSERSNRGFGSSGA